MNQEQRAQFEEDVGDLAPELGRLLDAPDVPVTGEAVAQARLKGAHDALDAWVTNTHDDLPMVADVYWELAAQLAEKAVETLRA